jgi:small subunit ribosomal protein S9
MKGKVGMNLSIGVGRRKTSVARVYLRKGQGAIKVNGKDLQQYFPVDGHVSQVKSPLVVTGSESQYDVVIRVVGGGVSGQAGACRHGLARALALYDQTNRTALKAIGYLRRDSRMVERKKYGQPGARRRFQFSKR